MGAERDRRRRRLRDRLRAFRGRKDQPAEPEVRSRDAVIPTDSDVLAEPLAASYDRPLRIEGVGEVDVTELPDPFVEQVERRRREAGRDRADAEPGGSSPS